MQIDYDVKKTNLSKAIADNLEEMIVHNSQQLGEKLPSEQSLADNFGVSRNVIRESMKLLLERGLVIVRAGGGAYISKPDPNILTNMIARFIAMDGINDMGAHDVRILLETESCRLTTLNATDKDFDELQLIIDEMIKVFDDVEHRVKLDIQFHTRIAEMSGNRLLTLFVGSMAILIQTLIKQAVRSKLGSDSAIDYHARILSAMRTRNVNLATELMSAHLQESKRRYISVSKNSTSAI